MMIEAVSFGTACVAFFILALVLLTGQRENMAKRMFALASVLTALWAGSVTYQASVDDFASISSDLINLPLLLELLRALGWFGFLLMMLRTAYKSTTVVSRKFRMLFAGVSAIILSLMLLAQYRISGGSMFDLIAGNDVLIGHLLISIGGMVILEQLFRNTSSEQRWAMKYLWIGIFSMFAYDFYLYSNALLYQRISNELWNARGFIHAMAVPLIGVAIRREMRWSLSKDSIDVYISRHALFHTTTLIAAGLYMLVMGMGGYYVREYGGSWGEIAQAMFMFSAAVFLAVLLFSGKIRARLKVFLEKHFFHYKYDYREEWLRINRTLSVNSESARLQERAIRALAQIIDSPAGMLWLKRENGHFEPEEFWNMEKISARERPGSSLVRFLEEQQFVISIDEYRTSPEVYTRLGALDIPAWLDNIRNAWLVVPLMLNDSLLGFVVLAHSSHQHYYNWEDSDLLKTAGRQVASNLAQYLSAQALSEAKRFEEMNRLSAFVVHDLKNMIGQLSMVVSNAARHKNNPLFMEDAISTIENSVNKMNSLLSRLRGGGTSDSIGVFNLCNLLEETVRISSKSGILPIPVLNCQLMEANIIADRERMAANLAHMIQNARDATDVAGRITIRLKRNEGFAVIEIEDTGCGMDEEFIKEKLFKPFVSTKGTMGIGVYQVREYVYKLGGDMEVLSKKGVGTTFRLHIPLATSGDSNIKRPQLMQR